MKNLLETSFSFQDFPRPIVDFLKNNKKIGLVLEEKLDTDIINIGVKKIYNRKVMELSEDIDRKYAIKEKNGYTKEEAINDFLEVKREIEKLL